MTKTKEKYRRWIRSRHGTVHKDNSNDKHKNKRWRINQNHIIENFIEEYELSGFIPSYMITRVYFYNMQKRDEVEKHNHRMNNVIDDMMNPRGMNEYFLMHDHYIERHKDQLVKKAENKRPVLNTIINRIVVSIVPNVFLFKWLFKCVIILLSTNKWCCFYTPQVR